MNVSVDNKGFTLIEMMVVVAIVGILASIAFPSYQNVVAKSRRQDAMDVLTGLASALERYKTVNNTYVGASLGGDAPIYPAHSPIGSGTKYYDLVINHIDASSFTIQADPISGSSQEGDGLIELASTNQRGWDEDDSGGIDSSEHVWN